MCELVRYHGAKSMIDFSRILCGFDKLIRAIGPQLQGSIRIDRTTLWQEFMMHHAIAIDENSEQIFILLHTF